jgi:hypothetical protein
LKKKEYFKIHFEESIKNKLYFRFNHPIFPTLIFGIPIVLILYLAPAIFSFSILESVTYFSLGVVSWTFIEYIFHRFIYHSKTKKEPWHTWFCTLHIKHHQNTKDPGYALAPPFWTLFHSLIFFGIFWLLTRHLGISLLLISGVNFGNLIYEWIHYGVHQFNWEKGLLGFLKKYHYYHHFQRSDEVYGVSIPLWDYLLGTKKTKKVYT